MSRKPSVADRTAGYFQSTEKVETPRTKRTWYIPNNLIVALDEIQLKEHKETGKKPDLSNLVAEALTLLAEQRGVEVS